MGGATLSFYADTPSGGTIVLLAIAVFLVAVVVVQVRARLARRLAPRVDYHPHEHGEECGHPAVLHGDHVDYLHDGHRHAAHVGHYHEHHHGQDVPVTSERERA